MPICNFRGPLCKGLIIILCAISMTACSNMMMEAGNRFATNLSAAVADNDDPAIVEAGSTAYLLLLDALVRQEPKSPAFRQAAATLNSAYAGAFIKDPERAARLSQKALIYAVDAVCLTHEKLCQVRVMPLDEMNQQLAVLKKTDVPQLFVLGSAWAGWIQAHSDDLNAVADLSRVEAIMKRVLALDEAHQGGMAHLYMGVIATAIPPALGGRPEIGRAHFEKAQLLSERHNLMVNVYFAKNYARGVYDRELHDALLKEVIEADAQWPNWTLSNTLAKKEAQDLLKTADDFF